MQSPSASGLVRLSTALCHIPITKSACTCTSPSRIINSAVLAGTYCRNGVRGIRGRCAANCAADPTPNRPLASFFFRRRPRHRNDKHVTGHSSIDTTNGLTRLSERNAPLAHLAPREKVRALPVRPSEEQLAWVGTFCASRRNRSRTISTSVEADKLKDRVRFWGMGD